MPVFLISNGAMQTTAAPVAVTTGTAIKTMLQIRPLALLQVVLSKSLYLQAVYRSAVF